MRKLSFSVLKEKRKPFYLLEAFAELITVELILLPQSYNTIKWHLQAKKFAITTDLLAALHNNFTLRPLLDILVLSFQ